jgi:hypothetical protein
MSFSLLFLMLLNSVEPPVAGRPVDFNGAVGIFRIDATATPTRVKLGDPILFTLHVTGTATVETPPARPNLKINPLFKGRFQIDDLDSSSFDGLVWTFAYRLRPLDSAVAEIPSVCLVYYKPGVIPPAKGYRSVWTRAIPVQIMAENPVTSRDLALDPALLPAAVQIVSDDPKELLRHAQPQAQVSLGEWTLLLIFPPCLAGLVWFWTRPATASAHAQAARRAILLLRQAKLLLPEAQVREADVIFYEYLREGWDIQPDSDLSQPPASGNGLVASLGSDTAEFQKRLTAARFAPGANMPDSAQRTIDVIQRIEAVS